MPCILALVCIDPGIMLDHLSRYRCGHSPSPGDRYQNPSDSSSMRGPDCPLKVVVGILISFTSKPPPRIPIKGRAVSSPARPTITDAFRPPPLFRGEFHRRRARAELFEQTLLLGFGGPQMLCLHMAVAPDFFRNRGKRDRYRMIVR
jgi:hypothetical protein